MNITRTASLAALIMSAMISAAQTKTTEPIPYGDFEHWVRRTLRESVVIGGHEKVLYEVGPERTYRGATMPHTAISEALRGTQAMFTPKYRV